MAKRKPVDRSARSTDSNDPPLHSPLNAPLHSRHIAPPHSPLDGPLHSPVTGPYRGLDAETALPVRHDRTGSDSLSSPLGESNQTRESRAEGLVLQALETDDPRLRIRLARQAIRLSPHCVAALILLGTAETDANKRLACFQRAIAAVHQILGRECLDCIPIDDAFSSTFAPLIGAMIEASNSLWALNRCDESVQQLQEVLRLMPDDSLGVRFLLLYRLLFRQQDQAAARLLDEFADDTGTEALYARALITFRLHGDTTAARRALRSARKYNKLVPEFLVGYQSISEPTPARSRTPSRIEAETYCDESLRLWRDTPGAIPWVRNTLRVSLPQKRRQRINKRDWPKKRARLLDLPRDPIDVWLVGLEPIATVETNVPNEPEVSDEPGEPETRPAWGFVVISERSGAVVSGEFSEEKPSAETVLNWLVLAMLHPTDGIARRPGCVQIADPAFAAAWQHQLAEVEVPCASVGALHDVQEYLAKLRCESQRLTRQDPNQLLDDVALTQLPQRCEEWQLDLRLLAAFIGDRGTPCRPWTVLVGDASHETVVAQDLSADEPTTDWLVKVVRSALGSPIDGPSRRPTVIRVATIDQHERLATWLKSLGIRCLISENLEFLDGLFVSVTRHLAGDDCQPGMLSVPGVTPEIVAGVLDAAAEFYRAAPWRLVPGDVPIQIECKSIRSGPWYAIMMGQSGILQGLALYDDWRLLRKLLSGRITEQESLNKSTSLAIYYGEAFDFPAPDLNDQERFGWQVAGPEAYPTILRIHPGMRIRRPLAWELQLVEACLGSLVRFTASGTVQPVTYDLPTAAGPLQLELDWIR